MSELITPVQPTRGATRTRPVAGSEASAEHLLRDGLRRLAGLPSSPGPLTLPMPSREPTAEVAEVLEILERARGLVAPGGAAAVALERGAASIRALGTNAPWRSGVFAADVLAFSEAIVILSARQSTPARLARSLFVDQGVALLGRLRKDDSSGMIMSDNALLAARFVLTEVAHLLGPTHVASVRIASVLGLVAKDSSWEVAQNRVAKLIGELSRTLVSC